MLIETTVFSFLRSAAVNKGVLVQLESVVLILDVRSLNVSRFFRVLDHILFVESAIQTRGVVRVLHRN